MKDETKRILHVLAAKPHGQSALYINGEESVAGGEDMQKIVELSFLAGQHKSPWCGIINGHTYIKGLLKNKDENGNEMAFSYCIYNSKCFEYKQLFRSDLEKNGYEINAETKLCLEHRSFLFLPKKYGMVVVAVILLIIIFLFIIIK